MKSSSKSPLKDKPLRLPGQSLEEEHRRLIEEKLEQPLLAAAFLTALAMLEWNNRGRTTVSGILRVLQAGARPHLCFPRLISTLAKVDRCCGRVVESVCATNGFSESISRYKAPQNALPLDWYQIGTYRTQIGTLVRMICPRTC